MLALWLATAIALTPGIRQVATNDRGVECGWADEAGQREVVLRLLHSRVPELEDEVARRVESGLDAFARWVTACDATASREASQVLRRAVALRPASAITQATLAVVLARGVEVQPPESRLRAYRSGYRQSNAEQDAVRAFESALDAWPAPELALELAALALVTRDPATLGAAASRLSHFAGSAIAAITTARAEIALAMGDVAEARRLAVSATQAGDETAARILAIAALRSDADPTFGGRQYLQALEAATPSTLSLYYEDLALLLSREQRVEWERTDPEVRKDWLIRQWRWRASTSGRSVAERLALHFERVAHAYDLYRKQGHRGARPIEALSVDTTFDAFPFDERGLLHIRHGAPDEVVTGAGARSGAIGREAWIYRDLERVTVFEFRRLPGWPDAVAVAPALCDPFEYMYDGGGASAEFRLLRGEPPITGWSDDFERHAVDFGVRLGADAPWIAVEAQRCREAVRRGVDADVSLLRLMNASRRAEARRDLTVAMSSENATPHYDIRLHTASSVYAFRGPGYSSEVIAFVDVPAGGLTLARTLDVPAYSIRFAIAVEDPGLLRSYRMDTTMMAPALSVRDGDVIRLSGQIEAAAIAEATIRVRVEDAIRPERGGLEATTRTIREFPLGIIALSDIVIGEEGRGRWRRGEVVIHPSAGHQLEDGSDFDLFYEIYGITPTGRLRTTITLAPESSHDLLARLTDLFADRRALRLVFEETHEDVAGDLLQVVRRVGHSLRPGRYHLEIIVESLESRATARASTWFELTDGQVSETIRQR